MINAYANALRMVYNTIPREILEEAFRPRDYQVSLDQRIKDVIVSGRVLPDCNVNVGKIKRIPLNAMMIEQTVPDPGLEMLVDPSAGSLFRVPPHMREYRDIVGVIDIAYPYSYTGANDASFGFGMNGNTVRSLAGAVIDSFTHSNACLTPTPTLMENNLILITPNNGLLDEWILVCRLGYDDEFTNLTNAAIPSLCRLIVTATQAYIWVNLSIRIDAAALSNGQELGQFKTIVEKYEIALEKYDEDLMNFRGSALFDPELARYMIRNAL